MSRWRTPAELLGETAARCYGFDLDALGPIAAKIGPTRRTWGRTRVRSDPAEVATARWWKEEYQVQAPG